MLRPLTHTPYLPARLRFGVLLNGNARRISARLVEKLRPHLPISDLYYTRSLEEAQDAFREIYLQQYDVLLVGGGDGSLLQAMTALQHLQSNDRLPRRLPAFGVLPFGTGNAVAASLGGDRNIVPLLERLQTHQHDIALRHHHWVDVEGHIAPFAGLGFDSLALNKYKSLNASLKQSPFSFLGRGLLGYLNAVFLMAIPSFVWGGRTEIEVINEGKTAQLIGPDGKVAREYAQGEVLFRGRPIMTAVSTVSCFGFHFQNFPFATDGQRMQLRVAELPVLDAVVGLPAVWRGTFRHPQLHDFIVQSVRVRCEKPLPLQIGGDASGYRDEVLLKRTERPTLMADLSKERRPLLAPIAQGR